MNLCVNWRVPKINSFILVCKIIWHTLFYIPIMPDFSDNEQNTRFLCSKLLKSSPVENYPKIIGAHCLFLWKYFDVKGLYVVVVIHRVVSDSATSWTAARQASLTFSVSQSLLKIMSIELVMPSNHSSCVAHFSSCPQSFPASGSFPMNQFFTSGGQSIGASAPILPITFRVDIL